MSIKVENWPFLPPQMRTHQEEERWWAECYVPSPHEAVLQAHPDWTIVTGDAGSGKSTLLRAFKHSKASTALILEDDIISRRGAHAEESQNLLFRILRAASRASRQHFLTVPANLGRLSRAQQEFLRWLIEKFNDPRSYVRWLDGLPAEWASIMQSVPFMDLYQTQVETQDVQAQIEELLNLSRRLDCGEIIAFVDVDYPPTSDLADQIIGLFDWLEPMQHIGLRIVAAMSHSIVDKSGLLHKTRGRVNAIYVEATENRTMEIIGRHLQAATGGQIKQISDLADAELLARLTSLTINEFGVPACAGWLGIVDILLEYAKQAGMPSSRDAYPEIEAAYYKKYCPLRLIPSHDRRGVWRGHKFLQLDEGPYELLEKLWRQRGKPMDHQAMGTMKKEYVHTLTRRLRVAIEPDPSNPLYILNRRNEGYWLENFLIEEKSGL